MTKFRPCIDLHGGVVKQIVGGTLRDNEVGPKENFVSEKSAAWFARKYREDDLVGGHVICLGSGNRDAALDALFAWPGGLQVGGGITLENASSWLAAGASHVIVTSMLFDQKGNFLAEILQQLVAEIGKEKLAIDLSCRSVNDGWQVAMNRWQTLTSLSVTKEVLDELSNHCAEFLIHAADVEGLCNGIDHELVKFLGEWGKVPVTYAGGVANFSDVEKAHELSGGKIDITVGSALDLFGGNGVKYEDLILWNQRVK
jgi:phosphoribosylformimino-5-aminoimidazole carboxamide ribotide isomerase